MAESSIEVVSPESSVSAGAGSLAGRGLQSTGIAVDEGVLLLVSWLHGRRAWLLPINVTVDVAPPPANGDDFGAVVSPTQASTVDSVASSSAVESTPPSLRVGVAEHTSSITSVRLLA